MLENASSTPNDPAIKAIAYPPLRLKSNRQAELSGSLFQFFVTTERYDHD